MKKTLAIILSVMMILSTVSFAAPVMTGTVANAGEVAENVAMETENDDAAELTSADEWTHETYGTLLYEMTFETGEGANLNGGAEQLISEFGRVNPAYPKANAEWKTKVTSSGTATIVAYAKLNHLPPFDGSPDGQWPQMQTNAGGPNDVGKMFEGVGYYTLVSDVKWHKNYTDNDGNVPGYKKTVGDTTDYCVFNEYCFNARYQYHLAGDSKT